MAEQRVWYMSMVYDRTESVVYDRTESVVYDRT